jgi:hypothetical protein
MILSNKLLNDPCILVLANYQWKACPLPDAIPRTQAYSCCIGRHSSGMDASPPPPFVLRLSFKYHSWGNYLGKAREKDPLLDQWGSVSKYHRTHREIPQKYAQECKCSALVCGIYNIFKYTIWNKMEGTGAFHGNMKGKMPTAQGHFSYVACS